MKFTLVHYIINPLHDNNKLTYLHVNTLLLYTCIRACVMCVIVNMYEYEATTLFLHIHFTDRIEHKMKFSLSISINWLSNVRSMSFSKFPFFTSHTGWYTFC